MNQSQYNSLLADLKDVFDKHGFHSRAVKVQGQRAVEDKILHQKANPYEIFHADTYGSRAIYQEFKKTGDLKLVWARMSSSVRLYELDPVEVAKISPDYCPVTGALIDYGYGFNQVTDNPYFRPGIDHKIAVGNGGVMLGDITNAQIVSQFYNTIKNYGTTVDALKWLFFDLTNVDTLG